MRQKLDIFVLAAVIFGLAGCVTPVRERVVIREQSPRIVVREMPAPVVETVSVQPRPGFAWVAGHWAWTNSGWLWRPGHWYQGSVRPKPAMLVEEITIAPSPAHFWVPGHWHWQGNDWQWVRGHWTR